MAKKLTFGGSVTALITPFKNGKVDSKKFQEFVAWQIAQGTQGVVPCGTTGESPTLSHEEHRVVNELCIEVAKGKVPVIAGAGSNATAEAIALTQHAEKSGADAVLHVTPYYNKPTQAGLYAHFKAIHDNSSLPIFIYNIPPRSVISMTVETMAKLAELPRIVGVKDATNDLTRPVKTRLTCGPDFIQFSGEDGTALAFLAQGGHGCISVTSNVAPALCAQMHAAWQKGDVKLAQAIQDKLMPLHDALFTETSPGPVKFAASLMGWGENSLRLPLVPVSKATEQNVEMALQAAGLLELRKSTGKKNAA
ncbi:MAG: 4-hydroxy-tetrahydrodipicolinate synthase [Alphaproteobacteria bacterium]|nr:4-hydroxy-tetrahydrodipicolinate synthase [Alphaproteobacteria bacterium]